MIEGIVGPIRRWAGRGGRLRSIAATALTHGLVVAVAGGAGLLLGLVAIYVTGLAPFFAFAFPLTGTFWGVWFYANRELVGPQPDIEDEGFWAKVDSVVDFVVPAFVAHALIYGTVLLYGALGAV